MKVYFTVSLLAVVAGVLLLSKPLSSTESVSILPDCQTAPDGVYCNDLNHCTVDDTCRSGICVGTPRDVNDNDDCTLDSCTPERRGVVHLEIAGCCKVDEECDDNAPCTLDTCVSHACLHSPISGCCLSDESCDDQDPCTVDACISQACIQTPLEGCGVETVSETLPELPQSPSALEPSVEVSLPLPSPAPEEPAETPTPPAPNEGEGDEEGDGEGDEGPQWSSGKVLCTGPTGSQVLVNGQEMIWAVDERGLRTTLRLEIVPDETDETIQPSISPPLTPGDILQVQQTGGTPVVLLAATPSEGGAEFLVTETEPDLTFQAPLSIGVGRQSSPFETLSFLVTVSGVDGTPKWSSNATCLIVAHSMGGGCALIEPLLPR